MKEYYGGLEAGGTKFVCVVANGPDDILAEQRFPTTNPKDTIQKTIQFFQDIITTHEIKINKIGIGSFGPVDLNKLSPHYGCITSTPKPGWANVDLVGPIVQALNLPVTFDTDVNVAAIGEGKWGSARGLENFLYFTIGTGIGGGAVINGKPLHGLIHPEMGHIILDQDKNNDKYSGKCPFHGHCFEGLASGPSIEERWKISAQNLPDNHPAWDLESDYIAQAVSNFICAFSPQKIILGGGVMQQKHLFPLIHEKVKTFLNGYVVSDLISNHIDEYIVPPMLGNQAGMLGAIALAQNY